MKLLLCVGMTAIVAVVAATGAAGVSGSDKITTIAGTGTAGFSGDAGPATSAKLDQPAGVAVDGKGNVYIADLRNNRVRKVSRGGAITTFAGTGEVGFAGDGGLATSARLYAPEGVAVDRNGNVYIADRNNGRVRKVSPGGIITTFAGTGSYGSGSYGDGGPATAAQLRAPDGVAVDAKGNVYIVDRDHFRVRKVSTDGTISTIAGTVRGFSGDGGPATSAKLYPSAGVAVDGKGNVYIADTSNHRVRKVSPSGRITTFAGTGACGSREDNGPATSTTVCNLRGVAVDAHGNVYIADTHSSRVRKVNSAGTITTIAGTGSCGTGVRDGGPAIRAELCLPSGVAVDGAGSVYIVETNRARVRKVTTTAGTAGLALTLGGEPTQRLLAQKGITVTATCSQPCSLAATGSVKILGTSSVLGLTRATARLAAGKRTLTLRFAPAEQRAFRQLLKPGQQARAVVTVKATDKSGRTRTSTRIVAVRR